MKINQNILPTISGAVDLNASGSWISSFNLSKHPGEREDRWHELIDRVPLQGLIRPLSAIIQVQYGGGGI